MPDIPAGKPPFRVLLVEDDDDHAEFVRDLDAACSHHASRYVVKPREFEEFTTLMIEIGLYWLSCDERRAGLEEMCKA